MKLISSSRSVANFGIVLILLGFLLDHHHFCQMEHKEVPEEDGNWFWSRRWIVPPGRHWY
jgi:hypothetical protein